MGQDASTEVAKPDDNRSAHGLARSGNPNGGSGPQRSVAAREELWAIQVWSLVEKRERGSELIGFGQVADCHRRTPGRPVTATTTKGSERSRAGRQCRNRPMSPGRALL